MPLNAQGTPETCSKDDYVLSSFLEPTDIARQD
jgi:hypothetical protein